MLDFGNRRSHVSAVQLPVWILFGIIMQNDFFSDFFKSQILIESGGGRNFERPYVERPIFRNLKIANVKSYARGPVIRFFNLRNFCFIFFLNYLNIQILVLFKF